MTENISEEDLALKYPSLWHRIKVQGGGRTTEWKRLLAPAERNMSEFEKKTLFLGS